MQLRTLAHVRSGDKGGISDLTVVAHDEAAYVVLDERLTADAVHHWFDDLPVTRVERADLAIDIVEKRLRSSGAEIEDLTCHRIGVDAVARGRGAGSQTAPTEVRLRVAGRARTQAVAERIGKEVTGLWTNGPAGGGGARRSVTEHVVIRSELLHRDLIDARVEWVEV